MYANSFDVSYLYLFSFWYILITISMIVSKHSILCKPNQDVWIRMSWYKYWDNFENKSRNWIDNGYETSKE